MPQCDLKYSADLPLDATALLQSIEDVFAKHDDTAGDCKGRAWPAALFLHDHLLAEITLLRKPHRDAAFMERLEADLFACLKRAAPKGCWVSMTVSFAPDNYRTEYLL